MGLDSVLRGLIELGLFAGSLHLVVDLDFPCLLLKWFALVMLLYREQVHQESVAWAHVTRAVRAGVRRQHPACMADNEYVKL